MTVSAEGRVENQKLNQTAALLSFGWVFGFQLDLLEKNMFTLLAVTFTRPLDSLSILYAFDKQKLSFQKNENFYAPKGCTSLPIESNWFSSGLLS